MILRETPLIYETRRSDKLVIYHGGGGLGGKMMRVYQHGLGIVPRSVESMTMLDGKPIDFKNLIAVKWEAMIPDTLSINANIWTVSNDRPNYAEISRVAHLATLPRNRWGEIIRADHWQVEILGHIRPVKCKIVEGSSYEIVSDGNIVYGVSYRGISVRTLIPSDKIIEYDPETYGEQERVAIIAKINKLIAAYRIAATNGGICADR